jgi:hypothetical protein
MSSTQTTLEQLRKTPKLADKIEGILSKRFIYTRDMSNILASAIYSGQNVILFGPGGHAKSEMVEEVLEGLGLWDRKNQHNSQALVQSFGEGLTEDALWGGIDFKTLNSPTAPDMVFNVQNSFLEYPVAVFEELFDAPPFCLLPLKHTLQAGFLGKNGRNYPMKTKLIIACTNRNPEDIANMGETYKALLERFVLRQEVVWKTYTNADYFRLISKHPTLNMSKPHKELLCKLIADCHTSGHFISPRTAMKAMDILVGAAISRQSNHNEVIPEDFMALRHVAGFSQAVLNFERSINEKLAEIAAEGLIVAQRETMIKLESDFGSLSSNKVLDWCVIAKRALLATNALQHLSVPDALYQTKNELIELANRIGARARDKAIEFTNI